MFLIIIALLFLVFYILGEFVFKLINQSVHWTDMLFLGIVMYTSIVSLIQIFFPVNIFIPISIILLFLLNNLLFKNIVSYQHKYINSKEFLMFLVLSLLLYPFWKSIPKVYDHYLYHDQAISWFNTYKLSWGLGNLHGRFAFNNSLFPTIASFQLNYKSNWYVFNVFLFVLFLFKLNNFRSFSSSILTQIGTIIYALGVFIYGIQYFSGVSPDFQILIFVSVIVLNLIQYTKENRLHFYVIVLCAFSVTIKLTFTPLILVIGSVILFRDYRINQKLNFRLYILPIIIINIWILRSLMISGQLVYPFPPLHTEIFEHSVSKEQAENELIAVTGWAQSPGVGFRERYLSNKGTLRWFPEWYKKRFNHTYARLPGIGKISISVFAIISLISGVLMLLYFIINRIYLEALLVVGLLLNTIYWFISAPDYRFGFLNFFMLLMLPFLLNIQLRFLKLIVIIFVTLTVPFQIMFSLREGLKVYRHACLKFNSSNNESERFTKNGSLVQMKVCFLENGRDTFFYYKPLNGNQISQNIFPGLPNERANIMFKEEGSRYIFKRPKQNKND